MTRCSGAERSIGPLRSVAARRRRLAVAIVLGVAQMGALFAAVRDVPFLQPVAHRYALADSLKGARFTKLLVDDDGIVYVLTDRGVARLFGERLALDRSYGPFAEAKPMDLTVYQGELFYLLDDKLLSNGFSGQYLVDLPKGQFQKLAFAADGTVLLAGQTNLAVVAAGRILPMPMPFVGPIREVQAAGNRFYVLAQDTVYRLAGPKTELFHRGQDLITFRLQGSEVVVGTRRGYYALDASTARPTIPLQDRLPAVEVTCLGAAANGIWVGTTQGLFLRTGPQQFRYFASRRWLESDEVVDLEVLRNGDVVVLTPAGLSRIEFRTFTLAEKAVIYDRKIRQRHIRYGLCSELRLREPGDPTTAALIDTDNDGTWSSLYLASQAFRYAVTGEEEARAQAWETFDALERLQSITGLDGFPARTFERRGFKVSDPERWRPAPDPRWEWKGHTSSDEVTCQTFAYAVLHEVAARTPPERARIAAAYDRIAAHIVRNNYALVDVDGQPTLWGRWNPEYVNAYPSTVGDRRLNSAEMIAFLQLAFRLTGKELYRERAYDLFDRHGYLRNITNSMALLRPTPGVVYQGNDMGSEWNHSDDQLAFYNYWTLFRYGFDDSLRRLYALAIRDHWQLERVERNPSWNFIHAMSGAPQPDLEGAVWTLRNYPLDLVTWTVQNSHRRDLNRLSLNFRRQETSELLPPDERPLQRWNGNPFTLDGGDGGHTELAGDEFLLPYWMGRFLRLIQ